MGALNIQKEGSVVTPYLIPLSPSQYTAKLQQELQNLKVDMKNLDLLSPAAHRDLEALQSSGLEKIHYSSFFVQVSMEHLRPDHGSQRSF